MASLKFVTRLVLASNHHWTNVSILHKPGDPAMINANFEPREHKTSQVANSIREPASIARNHQRLVFFPGRGVFVALSPRNVSGPPCQDWSLFDVLKAYNHVGIDRMNGPGYEERVSWRFLFFFSLHVLGMVSFYTWHWHWQVFLRFQLPWQSVMRQDTRFIAPSFSWRSFVLSSLALPHPLYPAMVWPKDK